jgi:hypothetical protein
MKNILFIPETVAWAQVKKKYPKNFVLSNNADFNNRIKKLTP